MSLRSEGWGHYMAITINHVDVSSDESNWTFVFDQNFSTKIAAVDGPLDADGAAPMKSDGGDIRFSMDAEGATLLPLHVMDALTDNDPSNGVLEGYCKIPLVSALADTVIYMHWGKADAEQPDATHTHGRHNAVDSYTTAFSPYADTQELTSFDSVGSIVGSITEAGEISPVGKGTYYPGAPDNCIVYNRPFTGAGLNFTVEMLQRHTTGQDLYSEHKLNHYVDSLRFRGISNTFQVVISINGLFTSNAVTSSGAKTNTWKHSAIRRDGTYHDLIQNGVIADSDNNALFDVPIPNQAETNFGAVYFNGSYSLSAKCALSQIRVSSVTRSENWVAMNYKNQMNVGGFISWGDIQDHGGGSAPIILNYDVQGVVITSYLYSALYDVQGTININANISLLYDVQGSVSLNAPLSALYDVQGDVFIINQIAKLYDIQGQVLIVDGNYVEPTCKITYTFKDRDEMHEFIEQIKTIFC
jgi:hypothetical protein